MQLLLGKVEQLPVEEEEHRRRDHAVAEQREGRRAVRPEVVEILQRKGDDEHRGRRHAEERRGASELELGRRLPAEAAAGGLVGAAEVFGVVLRKKVKAASKLNLLK